jgi:multidrug efflux system outer membrane protein
MVEPGGKKSRETWWTIFGDAELNRLEDQALEANQELRIATARISEARAQARVAAADFFPNVDVNATGERVRTSNTLPYQKGELIGNNPFAGTGGGMTGGAPLILTNQPLTTTQNHFRVPAELNWELDLFGRVRHQYGAARAEAQAALADFQAMHLSVTANVAGTYFMLRAADAENDVLTRAISTRREALRIAEERLQAGLTSELDVVRARSDLASNEAGALTIERSRAEMENALATLLGQSASEVQIARRPIKGNAPVIRVGIPSELLERRPDIARVERELAATSEQIGVAHAAFFPQIRLTGASGFESADLGLLFNAQSRFWEIGPSIHLPIFEGGRNTANLRGARARYEQALGRYRQQVLVAFQEVESALSDIRTLSGEFEAQGRVIAAAQRALELSQQQYQKGAINFLDVLDAERSVLQAQRSQAQLLGQRMQATVQLIKALGGDWR